MAWMGFRHRHSLFSVRPKPEPDISLIALIDLLLVVLMFVLMTSTLSKWSQLGLNLASSRAGTEIARTGLRVAVLRDGSIRIGDTQALSGLDASALVKALIEAQQALGAKRDSNASVDTSKPDHIKQSDPATLAKATNMMIYADRLAPHGAVVRVMDAARQAGIERVGLVTQKD
jgi:biopolymer transport protein ExbD